jgi:IMP cyclohydrolase
MKLDAIAEMEYPGRMIVVGATANKIPVVIYGLSGRSDSSKARVLKNDGLRVFTEPTDQEKLEKGDPALLIYNAVLSDGETTVVSNGAQTNLIQNTIDAYAKTGQKFDADLVLPVSFA